MVASIKITGHKLVARNITRLARRIGPAAQDFVVDETMDLATISRELAPYATPELPVTNLRESQEVTHSVTNSSRSGEVAFHAEYAAYIHEHPRSGQTGGRSPSGAPYYRWARVGQWKYLEQPLFRMSNGYAARLATHFQRRVLR